MSFILTATPEIFAAATEGAASPCPPAVPSQSTSVDLFGAGHSAARALGQRVASGRSPFERFAIAGALLLGTALCTAAAVVLGWFTALTQTLALPFFLWRGPKTWQALKDNLWAIVQESVALGITVATICLPPMRPELRNHEAPLIVMIHGYAHSGAAWLYYDTELKDRGFECVALDWGHPLQSLETAAAKIRDQIEALGLPRDRQILAVGHSTGGVIAQRLLADGDVNGIVTLGAPHQGTPLAVLAPGRCMQQMRPSSPDLAGVNSADSLIGKPRTLIRASSDLLVPADSALLMQPGAEANDEPGITRLRGAAGGHISLLYSPQVVESIAQAARQLSS